MSTEKFIFVVCYAPENRSFIVFGKRQRLTPCCWLQGVVTVGDYDGVVSQMHLESGHFIADLDDHGGSRSV